MDSIIWATKFVQSAARSGIGDPRAIGAALRDWRSASDSPDHHDLLNDLLKLNVLTQAQLDQLISQMDIDSDVGQLPGIELLTQVGVGSRGRVYKARQTSLNRLVAIKVHHRVEGADMAKLTEKLKTEARVSAKLNHPNIVQVYDVGAVESRPYLVMEFVDGDSVANALIKRRRYPEPEAIAIIAQVCQGLEQAHEKGIIHCDIKPANILVDRQGHAKLADFGIARLTGDNSAAQHEMGMSGTPGYASPEQFAGAGHVKPGSDLYSLGATLYHMLTGQPPFQAKSFKAMRHAHLHEPVTPPDHLVSHVSLGACQIVECAMAKSLDQRYSSASQMLEDIKAVARSKQPPHASRNMDFDVLGQLEAKGRTVKRPKRSLAGMYAWILLAASVTLNGILLYLLLKP